MHIKSTIYFKITWGIAYERPGIIFILDIMFLTFVWKQWTQSEVQIQLKANRVYMGFTQLDSIIAYTVHILQQIPLTYSFRDVPSKLD